MNAGDSTDKPQHLLDELEALRQVLGDDIASQITPQDIPILSDIVTDPVQQGSQPSAMPDALPDTSGDTLLESDPAPEQADELLQPEDDLPLENIDEEAMQDTELTLMSEPEPVNQPQQQMEELIDELVAEWLPVLESSLRERLQHLTEAELRSLR